MSSLLLVVSSVRGGDGKGGRSWHNHRVVQLVTCRLALLKHADLALAWQHDRANASGSGALFVDSAF